MKLLVSIISPVYNCEKYLDDFLTSIEKQTYQNFEVILIDDGSTDNSKKVIEKFTKKDKRFKYFYQENQGAPIARNLGISKVTGDIIYIPDSDDTINEYTLEYFVNEIENNNADIVMGNYSKIDENNKILTSEVKALTLDYDYKSISDFMFAEPFPGNKCYKTSLIKDNNIVFENVKIAQDLNFYLRVLPYAKKIVNLDKVVYNYRISTNSISRTYTSKILDIVKSIESIEKFYKKNKIDNVYLENLEFIKLFHYYGQLVKVDYIKDKNLKKVVYYFFKYQFNKLNLKDKKDFNKHIDRYKDYKKRLKYNFILSSKLYFKLKGE